MAVPTATDLQERFAIASQIGESRISFAIETALSDIEDAIGRDAYAEIFEDETSTLEDTEDDLDTTATNETATRIRKVTNAVYFKAIANCLENANTRIRVSGSVKREQDTGSPGMGAGGQIVNEYLSPDEVQTMVASFESKAASLLSPYLLNENVNLFVEFDLVRG